MYTKVVTMFEKLSTVMPKHVHTTSYIHLIYTWTKHNTPVKKNSIYPYSTKTRAHDLRIVEEKSYVKAVR